MIQPLIVILCLIGISAALPTAVEEEQRLHPDVGLTVLELIVRHGYPLEVHRNVETEDGYLLDMHRIPHGRNNAGETNKPVVLLMHGLLASSAEWVNMGPKNGLAYLLADLGYDVWMGNARGNTWSRKHIIYNPNRDSRFWDFSWHHIGIFDLPAKIDHILRVTRAEKIFYVGHSQGTTSFFVMTSERPEYNDKIRLMVALAPVVYMSNMTNPFFQLLSLFHNTIEWVASFIGMDEFLPSNGLFQLIGQVLCNDESLFQGLCANSLFLIAGWNSAQLNQTMIPVITTSAPAGSSTRQLIHYAQGIRSGRFRQYDRGLISNIIHYGSATPPTYNIGNIKVPVALFYSANDWLAAVVDVNQFYRELPNAVFKYLMPDQRFNHLDFLFAIDVVDMLYNRVADLMSRY